MNPVPADREQYGPLAPDLPFECGTDGPRVIMVGVDGGAAGERAAAYAGGLARRQRAQLVVVFVAAPSPYLALAPPGLSAAVEKTVQELTEEMRRHVSQRAEELALPVTFLCRRGAAAVELARVADELRVDMVVIGAAARRRGHRLIGPVARRLIRTARWPVVVVP